MNDAALPLWDPGPDPLHRDTDPDTSRSAAEHRDSFGPLTKRVMTTLLECERTTPSRTGATAYEIRHRMSYDREQVPETGSVCRRFTSLARAGFVRDTGVRRKSGAGREQIAWASTAEGRAWLESR